EQMILGTTGNDVEAALDEYLSHGLGVLHNLLLVGLEFRLKCFLETDCLGGNDMFQRTALGAREYRGVELLLDCLVGLGQNQAATRTAQGLVSRGGDHVGERYRVRVNTSSD